MQTYTTLFLVAAAAVSEVFSAPGQVPLEVPATRMYLSGSQNG
jgi:hypothetical protein